MRPHIAYSSESKGDIRGQLGAANYSYRFAEDALVDLLRDAGYQTSFVSMPESFKHRFAYESRFGSSPDKVLHIAFRSTENIRPMAGAKNVCHFAWEFDVLKTTSLPHESVLQNQTHMLKLMDEIWVACEYSKTILCRHGVTDVHVVPAPVAGHDVPARYPFDAALDRVGAVPSMSLFLNGPLSREDNGGFAGALMRPLRDHPALQLRSNGYANKIFLAVINPGDLRKNLLNMIEGFQLALGPNGKDLLIIKLIVPNKGDFRSFGMYDHLLPRCNGDLSYSDSNVIMLMDYLKDYQMSALFSLADYYISPTHCEGYNRPLLQAMSFGTVPVSTYNTAMVDYIHDSNSIIIPERAFTGIIPGMAGDQAGQPYAIHYASRLDIGRAVRHALEEDAKSYDRRADQCREDVMKQYSASPCLKRAVARIEAMFAQPVQ